MICEILQIPVKEEYKFLGVQRVRMDVDIELGALLQQDQKTVYLGFGL